MKSSAGGSLNARVLIVDDERANVALLESLLAMWGYDSVLSTTRSQDALDLCLASEPDLILLDIHMPPPDGFGILEALSDWRRERIYVPVVVLTADVSRTIRDRALALGASDFLTKPFEETETRLRIANLLEIRRLNLELRAHNEVLEEHVRSRTSEVNEARLETLDRLAIAAEYRDDDTQQHARRVGRTAAMLAEAIGRSEAEIELIRRAAPLHDIGKIGVSDSILLKPARLTPTEFAVMRRHTLIGQQILAGSRSRVLQLGEEIALTHHERWNGKGYPNGLAGEEIPLVGRLVALADMFDALTHKRPYKEAWPLDEALAEMRLMAGRHLDPGLVRVFESFDHEELLAPIEQGLGVRGQGSGGRDQVSGVGGSGFRDQVSGGRC